MGNTKQIQIKDIDIISASEIGQYHYCSVAWYLQKCGYEPESHSIDVGKKKHVQQGYIIDKTKSKMRKSRNFVIIGYSLIILSILVFIFGVFL
ncbi:MAG: hypothetical protein JSW62_03135, partial [Thermoplasmatales archaeon]